MKGRKPALKLIAAGEPIGPCPGPAPWLSRHSADEWRRVAPLLHAQGRLTAKLTGTLEIYCAAIGQVREAAEIMKTEGRIIHTDKGLRRHPAIAVQSTAMREARLLAAELRLTREPPSAPKELGRTAWDADLLA